MTIHFTTAFAAIDAAATAYNADRPLKEQIRAPHILLLQELVKITAAHRHRIRALAGITFPPLRTNNLRLADAAHCSPRTIHRLLARLQGAKMIAKKFRGSKADFEVSISPALLGLDACTTLPNALRDASDTWAEAAQVAALHAQSKMEAKATSWQHTGAGYTNKTLNEAVEKPETGTPEQTTATGGFSGLKDAGTLLQGTKRPSQTRANDEAAKPAARKPEKVSRAALAHIISLVSGLWLFTEKHLYSRLSYMANSQRVIGQAYFIGLFLETPRDRWELLRSQLLTRLYVVDDWLQKDSSRYVPVPEKYFDPDNLTGFAKTETWVAKMNLDTKRLEHYRQRYQLDAQIYQGYRKAIRHYLSDPNSLVKYQEALTRISRLSPDLLPEFQALVVDVQTGKLAA